MAFAGGFEVFLVFVCFLSGFCGGFRELQEISNMLWGFATNSFFHEATKSGEKRGSGERGA